MLSIEIITDKHLDMLQTFCQECDKLGYQNNSSLQSMKLLWCKQTGEYWCAVDNDKIVAVAGAPGVSAVDAVATIMTYDASHPVVVDYDRWIVAPLVANADVVHPSFRL